MAVNGIEITDVIVFPIRNRLNGSNTLALAKVIINDQFIINGIKIKEGRQGLYINFPHLEVNGKKIETGFPITAELKSYFMDQVLSQYSIAKSVFV